MIIKYLQNPEVIIANQHRSRYIPFSDRHLLSHNIDKVRSPKQSKTDSLATFRMLTLVPF